MDWDHFSPALTLEQVRRLTPAALAYLGDAIYELYVRRQLLFPPQRADAYHRQVVQRVRASAQAQALQTLIPHLSETEAEIVRRGRNGCGRPPRHLPADQYQQASGFETLLGYLYLTDPPRLLQILSLVDQIEGRDPLDPLPHKPT